MLGRSFNNERHGSVLYSALFHPDLNEFLISDKILINYRELYFEVVGHVYPNKMGNFPEMRCSVSKIMSKMTHVNYKNTNNCFQIGAADSFKCKTDHKKLYYISLVFS